MSDFFPTRGRYLRSGGRRTVCRVVFHRFHPTTSAVAADVVDRYHRRTLGRGVERYRSSFSGRARQIATASVVIPEALATDARPRCEEDPQVDDHLEDEGQVERTHRRIDRVSGILVDDALARLVRIVAGILLDEQRWNGDHRRQSPAGADHRQDPLPGSVVDVVDPGHRPVTIQRDGHQVEYGTSTTQDVERDPDVASDLAHEPPLAHFVDGGERHVEGGDHQFSHHQG